MNRLQLSRSFECLFLADSCLVITVNYGSILLKKPVSISVAERYVSDIENRVLRNRFWTQILRSSGLKGDFNTHCMATNPGRTFSTASTLFGLSEQPGNDLLLPLVPGNLRATHAKN